MSTNLKKQPQLNLFEKIETPHVPNHYWDHDQNLIRASEAVVSQPQIYALIKGDGFQSSFIATFPTGNGFGGGRHLNHVIWDNDLRRVTIIGDGTGELPGSFGRKGRSELRNTANPVSRTGYPTQLSI